MPTKGSKFTVIGSLSMLKLYPMLTLVEFLDFDQTA